MSATAAHRAAASSPEPTAQRDLAETPARTGTGSGGGQPTYARTGQKLAVALFAAGAPSPANARVVQLVRANSTALMDWPLPGGLPLYKASKGKIADAAAAYLRDASTFDKRGTWLKRIADTMPEGKTVAEVFGESDLAAIRDEIDK